MVKSRQRYFASFIIVILAITIGSDGILHSGELTGSSVSLMQTGKDSLPPYEIKDYIFPSGEITLAGRLFNPRSEVHCPVLIYVEGSDNDNTNTSPYVKALAKVFTKEHIALFSFNKRGYAGSEGTSTDDFDVRAADVVSAYKFLSVFDSIDRDNIGMYGISQAGWIIPRALKILKKIPFVILVSPAGVPPLEQVTFYLQNQWRKTGMTEEDISEATNLHRVTAYYYKTGTKQDYRKAQLAVDKASKKAWFPLLNKIDYRVEIPDSGILPTPAQLATVNKREPEEYAFYRSEQTWTEDPSMYQSIISPVLLIFGGKDELVPVERSMMIFQHSFAQNQNTDVTFHIFETSGHDIQPVGSPYLADGYREYMADWIHRHLITTGKR